MNINLNQDSLDYQKEQYSRVKSGYSQNGSSYQLNNQNQIFKQHYKQQLDDLVRQKQEQKKIQKQQQAKEKNLYNERINYNIQAEKMKDISYKNYYQVLINNQANISKNYVNPFIDRDVYKDNLITQRMEEEKKRSQTWHQLEQRRLLEVKKSYREELANQINQKYYKNTIEGDYKNFEKEEYKKLTNNPKQIAQFQRERRLVEMQKYKQDLDRNANKGSRVRERSLTNNASAVGVNDFNIHKIEDRHNPMVNPLPYNIQNPYLLKEMMRKQEIMNHN